MSVVATVGVSAETFLGASVGASLRASVIVSVEPSFGRSINLNQGSFHLNHLHH